MSSDKPLFEHDCEGCIFLGSYQCKRFGPVDLYFCGKKSGNNNTVIARYSSEGPDYGSGMIFALLEKQPYKEALDRAVARGLTTIEHELRLHGGLGR